MKLNASVVLTSITFACLLVDFAVSQSPSNGTTKWVVFTDCPVLLENRFIVPARESGIVESVSVDLNESVKRGQLLLSLEKDEAEANLKAARESHAYALEVAADDSDLELRKLAHKQAVEELASNVEISKSVSASELRRFELAAASAAVAVTNAERALKRMRIQADMAGTAVKNASDKLANREVHAPSDGIVTQMTVRHGQWIDAGKPVMEISDLKQLQVDCLIPIEKTDLKKLVGLEVRVECNHRTAAGVPIRLAGKITSYDPKLSGHGEVRVHCRIQNVQQAGHWLLLPEMNVRLEVAVPEQRADEAPALISKRPS